VSDVTRILSTIQAGHRHKSADLWPLVYVERRKLAAARLSNEAAVREAGEVVVEPWLEGSDLGHIPAGTSGRRQHGAEGLPSSPSLVKITPCDVVLTVQARHLHHKTKVRRCFRTRSTCGSRRPGARGPPSRTRKSSNQTGGP
jgi:hypothetical protein